jgi:hypothetical protein
LLGVASMCFRAYSFCLSSNFNWQCFREHFRWWWSWKWRVSRLRSRQYWGSRGEIYSAIKCAEWLWLRHQIFRDEIYLIYI